MADCVKCPVCNSASSLYYLDPLNTQYFYDCPVCGRYEVIEPGLFEGLDINHLASYLFYHRFKSNRIPSEYRYHTTLSKELCDKYKSEFEQGNGKNGHPVHMDGELVENWYPKSFSERIDYILLLIGSQIKHVGQQIVYNEQEAICDDAYNKIEIERLGHMKQTILKLLENYRRFLFACHGYTSNGVMPKGVPCNVEDPTIETTHGDVVHPCVRYIEEGFEGHQWWMVYTPYYAGNDKLEN